MTMFSKAAMALGLSAFVFAATPRFANADSAFVPPPVSTSQAQPDIIKTADGCGYGEYRGPYGYCHAFGTGPYPNGYYGTYAAPAPVVYGANGCPVGFWRGPWGDCRDTPYVGPLPGGGYQY